MSETEFQPLTPRLGITGSSYQLQLGKVNEFWAIRLVKGKDVLASKVYNNSPNPEEIPLGNHLTGWVLSVLAVPNINSYQIQKTIGFLRQKAQRNLEEQKRARKTAGKSERTEVKLNKVPENVQVKRPQAAGWVKEDKKKDQAAQAEAEAASPALAASNKVAVSRSEQAVSIRDRELPKIPMGEGFTPQPFKYGKTVASQQPKTVSSSTSPQIDIQKIEHDIFEADSFQSLIKRVEKLEYQVRTLEEDNVELRKQIKNLKQE